MSFNLKNKKAQLNINDQSSLDSYLQMLITQLNASNALPTEDALASIANMDSLSQYGVQSFEQLQDMIRQQMEVMEQQETMQNNMVAPPQEQGAPVVLTPTAKGKNKMTKPFNLKKAQIPAPFGHDSFNDTAELGEEQYLQQEDMGTPQKYKTHAELNDALINMAATGNSFQIAWNEIQGENPQEPDSAQAALKSYFDDFDTKGEEQRLADASVIYNLIYGNEEPVAVEAPYKELGASVQVVSETIQKVAQDVVGENKKIAYNITKTAQHKSLDNAILWGPGQSRIDPFLHQPVSDWHIVERNKGFGLVVDDIWNIDYETIWRENIMDKYSRPYKDKDGNWVGGYLNKRFEIDRNIPETSNLQLKPGQTRRPVVPEHGIAEARLQSARSKGDIAGANDTSKPFNWKEASKKKN